MTAASKDPEEIWKAYRPEPGDRIEYDGEKGQLSGTIIRTEGTLAFWTTPERPDEQIFIWCFGETLNKLHRWGDAL